MGKSMELRFSSNLNGNEAIKFVHTSFEHELGEVILTHCEKADINMAVISREDDVTEEGYKLACMLYNAQKSGISSRCPNHFETKVRLALCIMARIGRLSAEEQQMAHGAYLKKLDAERDARFSRYIARLAKSLGA